MVLGQPKIDMSLTYVSGVQAPCCMSPGYLTGGQKPFPPTVTSENVPRDIRLSLSRERLTGRCRGQLTAQGDWLLAP